MSSNVASVLPNVLSSSHHLFCRFAASLPCSKSPPLNDAAKTGSRLMSFSIFPLKVAIVLMAHLNFGFIRPQYSSPKKISSLPLSGLAKSNLAFGVILYSSSFNLFWYRTHFNVNNTLRSFIEHFTRFFSFYSGVDGYICTKTHPSVGYTVESFPFFEQINV